jgi:hypothetical protein
MAAAGTEETKSGPDFPAHDVAFEVFSAISWMAALSYIPTLRLS